MLTPAMLTEDLQAAWSRETSADPDGWAPGNPAWGQCAVSALVIQDAFGGELLRATSTPGGSHYWNRIDGIELDITLEQFGGGVTLGEPVVRTREYVLGNEATRRRYVLLCERVGRTPQL